jgi:hypothetical protein
VEKAIDILVVKDKERATGFLDWSTSQLSGLNPSEDTITLFWKACLAAKNLNLQIKPNTRGWSRFTLSHPLATSQENATSKDASKFISLKISTRKWRDELCRKDEGENLCKKGKYFFSRFQIEK